MNRRQLQSMLQRHETGLRRSRMRLHALTVPIERKLRNQILETAYRAIADAAAAGIIASDLAAERGDV